MFGLVLHGLPTIWNLWATCTLGLHHFFKFNYSQIAYTIFELLPFRRIILTVRKFFITVLTGVLSLESDSNAPQISWTLLNVMADFCCTTIWMVSILPLIFSSPSLFSRFLGNVPRAPTTIVNIVAFKFHNFFSSLTKCKYFSCFLPSFTFTLWLWKGKIH